MVDGPTGADPINSTTLLRHSRKTIGEIPSVSASARDSKKSICLETRGQITFLFAMETSSSAAAASLVPFTAMVSDKDLLMEIEAATVQY